MTDQPVRVTPPISEPEPRPARAVWDRHLRILPPLHPAEPLHEPLDRSGMPFVGPDTRPDLSGRNLLLQLQSDGVDLDHLMHDVAARLQHAEKVDREAVELATKTAAAIAAQEDARRELVLAQRTLLAAVEATTMLGRSGPVPGEPS